jgi:dTDP-4-dehydrorhamnose 3,5-epimerase
LILKPTDIAGAFLIEVEPLGDERGFFARTFCLETLRKAGVNTGPVRQTSISVNPCRGTLRGMHWQAEPFGENKLVRASSGTIYDVIVDIRPTSSSFRRWFGAELSAVRHNGLFVPRGCAHGFLTQSDDVTVEYAMDADFAPGQGRGARWNDPAFGIVWPFEPVLIGDRDRSYPDFAP